MSACLIESKKDRTGQDIDGHIRDVDGQRRTYTELDGHWWTFVDISGHQNELNVAK